MVIQIENLVSSIITDLKDNGELVEDPEAVLERIKVGLSVGYKDRPDLLGSIDDVLKKVGKSDPGKERSLALANHFLSYRIDITDMNPDNSLLYIKKIRRYFSKNSFAKIGSDLTDREKHIFSKHSALIKRLEKDGALIVLEKDGGVEKYIIKIGGVDARCLSKKDYDNFRDAVEFLSQKDWGEYVHDHLFHSRFEFDAGQVTAVSSEWGGSILKNADMRKVIEMFKCSEVVEVDDSRYRESITEREDAREYENAMRVFWGPFDADEEEYWFGPIDKSNPPEFKIRRHLCHTMSLEGKSKKIYRKYMEYQNKRFEGIKEYQKKFWLTIVNTSINCLLDQGYNMTKVIKIVEEELNPFANYSSQTILNNLKPILKRKYKG